ncbi:MAG TPA: hypothetical protein VMS17_14015, partial [Gemmataceae bacterium]|nr:hypothetical protein [Gemmataceae bacterium]
CLRKKPGERYASAAALADDLERFLDGKPIQVRPAGPVERCFKWARRRPTAAALIVVLAAGLLIGLAGVLWYNAHLRAERDRAEANFQLAVNAVDELLTEVGDEQLAYEPHMEQKRRDLLNKALAFSQRLLEEKGDSPEQRLRVALAHKRVADIHRWLGEQEDAQQAYRDASAMLTRLNAERPGEPEYGEDLAESENWLGESLRLGGRPSEAEEACRRALSLEQDLCEQFPQDAAYRREMAQTRYNMGLLCTETDRAAEAEASYDVAVGLLQPLVDANVAEAADKRHLARALLDRGLMLQATNRMDRAEADDQRAIALLKDLVQADPDNTNYRFEEAVALNNYGLALAAQSRWADARSAHTDSRALLADLVRDFPRTPLFREELANTLNSYGGALAHSDELDAADRVWSEARELVERLIAEQHGDAMRQRGLLGMTLGNQGWSLAKRENWPEARPLLQQAVADLAAARQAQPHNPIFRDSLADHYRSLAETLLQLKEHAPAAEAARAIPALFPGSGTFEYRAACFLARCAALAGDDSQLAEPDRSRLARSYADESLQWLKNAAQHGFSMQELKKPDQAKIFQALQDDPVFRALEQAP